VSVSCTVFTISTILKNGWIGAAWIMKIMKFQKLFVVKDLCKYWILFSFFKGLRLGYKLGS
jgi:hypothetical protein